MAVDAHEELKKLRSDREAADAEMKRCINLFDMQGARRALQARDIAERKIKRAERRLEIRNAQAVRKGAAAPEAVSLVKTRRDVRCEMDLTNGEPCLTFLRPDGTCPDAASHA